MTNMPFIKNVDCVSLKVDNIDKAIDFYSNKLGHELKWRTATSAGMKFAEGESELVIYTEQRPPGTDPLVESVPIAIEQFLKAGGQLDYGPIEIPVGLFAIMKDPWNNKINILDLSKGTFKVDQNRNVIGLGR